MSNNSDIQFLGHQVCTSVLKPGKGRGGTGIPVLYKVLTNFISTLSELSEPLRKEETEAIAQLKPALASYPTLGFFDVN